MIPDNRKIPWVWWTRFVVRIVHNVVHNNIQVHAVSARTWQDNNHTKTASLSLLLLQAVEAKANIRVEWHESLGLSTAEAVLALKRQHHYSTEEGQHEATRRINIWMQDIMRLNGFLYVAAAETDLNRVVSLLKLHNYKTTCFNQQKASNYLCFSVFGLLICFIPQMKKLTHPHIYTYSQFIITKLIKPVFGLLKKSTETESLADQQNISDPELLHVRWHS